MLNKIPSGWRIAYFGEVVSHIKDQIPNRNEWHFDRYIGGEHFDEGEIRVTKSAPIEGNEEVIGSAFHMRFKPGQILYVTRNPRLRKGGIVDFEGVCSNVTFTLEADDSQLLQSLLPFIIQTEDFVKHTTNNAHGSTNPFLNWKDLAAYTFYLPPIHEQKIISKILWAMEENVENAESLQLALNIFKKKVVNKLLFKGVRNKNYKKSEIGKIPSGWTAVKLGDIIQISSEKMQPPYKDQRYIGLENINSGLSVCTKFDFARNFKSITNKFQKGDILYGKLRPNLNKAVIADFSGLCTTEILVFRATKKSLNEFLMLHIRSEQFISYNTQLAFGTKMPRTSVEIISNYRIPLPPIQEQKKIVNIVRQIENQELVLNKYLINLKDFQRKLSNDLLAGRIRLG